MTKIHLEPEAARQTAQLIRQDAEEMQQVMNSLEKALNRLNNGWISPRADHFMLNARNMSKELGSSADSLLSLSLRMDNEINEWVSTDERGRQLFQIPLAIGLTSSLTTGGAAFTFPWLEGWLGEAGLDGITLPTGWSLAGLVSVLGSIPAWLQTWLDGIFGKPEVISPIVEEPETPPHETFGDLLKREMPPETLPTTSEPATPSAETSAPATTTTPPAGTTPAAPAEQGTTTTTAANGYDVPVYSQGKLYGNAACLPTSVAMVTNYYHAHNSNATAVSAETLINTMDKGDGTYGNGVGIDKLNDEIVDLGYQEPTIKVGASLDDLKTQLQSGPVIVNTGVKVTVVNGERALDGVGNTYHSMVVKGFSSDGSQVYVNDPWSGKEIDYSVDEFSKIWTKGQSIMTTIRPK